MGDPVRFELSDVLAVEALSVKVPGIVKLSEVGAVANHISLMRHI